MTTSCSSWIQSIVDVLTASARHADGTLGVTAGDHALMVQAFKRLPTESQLLLTLRFYEHLLEGEIAEVLGWTLETVAQQLEGAQVRLAEIMGDPRPHASDRAPGAGQGPASRPRPAAAGVVTNKDGA